VLDHLGVTEDSAADSVQIRESRLASLKKRLSHRASEEPAGGTRPHRRPRAAAHDAEMLLAVERLVKDDEAEPHPFGSRYWLLTLDRDLAEHARRSLDKQTRHICFLAEEWVQYIAPFVSPNISHGKAAEVFGQLLGSRFFVSLGGCLSLADLQPFTAPNLAELYGDLTAEELCDAVADSHAYAVRVGASTDEVRARSLDRFVRLAEDLLNEKVERNELVSAEEVELVLQRHSEDRAAFEASLSEREAKIRRLTERLASVEKRERASIDYRIRGLANSVGSRLHGLVGWSKRNKLRAAFLAVSLVSAGVAYTVGVGGQLASIALVALGVVVSVGPRAAVENLRAWFGLRGAKR
jgi:hypothetical protein